MIKSKNNELCLKSKVPCGKYKSELVEENLVNDKKEIFSLLKEGYTFTDETLGKAGILKKVSVCSQQCNRITDHITDNKVYEKDTMSLKSILKSIHTIESSMENDETFEEESKNKENDNGE